MLIIGCDYHPSVQQIAMMDTRRRKDLLDLLDQLNKDVEELNGAVEEEAKKRSEVRLLMTHPGVGPVTALAFVLFVGYPERFPLRKANRELRRTDSGGVF